MEGSAALLFVLILSILAATRAKRGEPVGYGYASGWENETELVDCLSDVGTEG